MIELEINSYPDGDNGPVDTTTMKSKDSALVLETIKNAVDNYDALDNIKITMEMKE